MVTTTSKMGAALYVLLSMSCVRRNTVDKYKLWDLFHIWLGNNNAVARLETINNDFFLGCCLALIMEKRGKGNALQLFGYISLSIGLSIVDTEGECVSLWIFLEDIICFLQLLFNQGKAKIPSDQKKLWLWTFSHWIQAKVLFQINGSLISLILGYIPLPSTLVLKRSRDDQIGGCNSPSSKGSRSFVV